VHRPFTLSQCAMEGSGQNVTTMKTRTSKLTSAPKAEMGSTKAGDVVTSYSQLDNLLTKAAVTSNRADAFISLHKHGDSEDRRSPNSLGIGANFWPKYTSEK
jgi:hypothetical protein